MLNFYKKIQDFFIIDDNKEYNQKSMYLCFRKNIVKNIGQLILDKESSHFSFESLDYSNNNNINRIFVPCRLTGNFRPLDIALMRS